MTLNKACTYVLVAHTELNLETVCLLDQVQNGNEHNLSRDAIAYLHRYKLVEWRIESFYLSTEVSRSIEAEANYLWNKALND